MKKKKEKDWSNKMQNGKDGGQNLPSPNKEQRGRSMIEMLGVLAIIGVLSVGGLAGYNTAMRKIQITKALNEMQLVIQDCLQQHLTLKKPSKNQRISSVNLQYFKETLSALNSKANVSLYYYTATPSYDFYFSFDYLPVDFCVSMLSTNWEMKVDYGPSGGSDTEWEGTASDQKTIRKLCERYENAGGNLFRFAIH